MFVTHSIWCPHPNDLFHLCICPPRFSPLLPRSLLARHAELSSADVCTPNASLLSCCFTSVLVNTSPSRSGLAGVQEPHFLVLSFHLPALAVGSSMVYPCSTVSVPLPSHSFTHYRSIISVFLIGFPPSNFKLNLNGGNRLLLESSTQSPQYRDKP